MTTTTTMLKETEKFYNTFIALDLNEEQKHLLNQYKLYINIIYNEYLVKQKKATSKYHKSEKGKSRNNEAQRKYYLKHKQKILQKKKQKYKDEFVNDE